MIDGERLRLREPREGDVPVLAELRNDLEVQRLILSRGRPNSLRRVQAWIDRVSNAEDAVLFVVADERDEPLGFVQVAGLDFVNGHGRLGIAIVEAARGVGGGREAVQLVGRYVREVFNLRKLVLEVAASNAAAIAAYEGVGFRRVGVLTDHVVYGGVPSDVLIMEWMLPG